jgi:hypothetical protein
VAGRRRHTRKHPELKRLRGAHWRTDGTAKTRFPNQQEANRASLQVRLDHGTDVVAYECEYCGGWHLGTNES